MVDKFHKDYRKSLIADFNKNYDRDIERGNELDRGVKTHDDASRSEEKEKARQSVPQHKEENKMKAKLTEEQIAEILFRPKEKPKVLAAEYGVSIQTIYNCRHKAKKAVRACPGKPDLSGKPKKRKVKTQDIAPHPESQQFEFATISDQKIKITIEIN